MQAQVCPANSTKSNARVRRYGKARQRNWRQHSMEREAEKLGITLSHLCACGCGLVIPLSIKRPYYRGHRKMAARLSAGVLRVVPTAQ